MTSSVMRQVGSSDRPRHRPRAGPEGGLEGGDGRVARPAGGRDDRQDQAGWRGVPVVQLELGRERRRPDDRPGRRRDRDPDPVTRQPAVAGRSQVHGDLLDRARDERLRLGRGSGGGSGSGSRPSPVPTSRQAPRRSAGRPRSRPAPRRPGGGRRAARRGSRRPSRVARTCRSARTPRPGGGRGRGRSADRRRPTRGRPRPDGRSMAKAIDPVVGHVAVRGQRAGERHGSPRRTATPARRPPDAGTRRPPASDRAMRPGMARAPRIRVRTR